MQEKNRTRRPLISTIAYKTGRIIARLLYTNSTSRYGNFKGNETLCKAVAPRLKELYALAGIKCPEELVAHPHRDSYRVRGLFIEAMRPAYDLSDLINAGQEVTAEKRELHQKMFAAFDEIVRACQKAEARAEKKREKRKMEGMRPSKANHNYGAGFNWPHFGVHYNDRLIVKETKKINPGQLIFILYDDHKDGGDGYFTRACVVKDETVRVCDNGSEAYDKPLSLVVGPVVEIRHDHCNHTKAEALRQRLRELGDDITDSTEAFKIEREIYALEHPPEEDEEEFEWPEVIGDE